MKPLAVSLLQAHLFWEDKTKNFAAFEQAIGMIPGETQVIVLPEMFATGFSMNPALAEGMDGTTLKWLKIQAANSGKIITGSIMIREKEKIFNRLVWMLPNGTFYHYDKRHLFGFGGEDAIFSPGEKRLIVQVNGWKICLQVCYDLRFPVWSRQQGEPYDLLLYVANWPEKRNHAWKTLLQARAIENQCYVAGVNRTGQDGASIAHSGDSAFIDPLGTIIEMVSDREAILTYTFQKEKLIQIREHFPFLKDADRFIIPE